MNKVLAVLSAILSIAVSLSIAEPNEPLIEENQVKAARIICTGMIDDGLYKSIIRRSSEALADGAE